MFDKAGSLVANLYPKPNRPGVGPDQRDNFFAVGAGKDTNDKVEGRIDWAHTDKHRMFGRWSQRVRQELTNPCFMCNGEDGAFNEHDTGFQTTLDNTFTPNPTLVIDVLLGLSYWQEKHNPNDLGKTAAITGVPSSVLQADIPPAF